MENTNKIFSELKDISPYLTTLDKANVYQLSPSYFPELASNVIEKINSGVEPFYYFTNQNPFTVPGNYFESLAPDILKKINSHSTKNDVLVEMEAISPLLNSISKTEVYTVPANYFQSVEWSKDEIPKQRAKTIQVDFRKKTFSYLVAAAIFGILAIAIFLVTGKETPGLRADGLHAISKVRSLSEQEIMEFLKTTSPNENIISSSVINIKDNDIKNSVSKMSDKEIRDFLQENGEENEM